ncbi:MAG TPA: hypothetical protein VJR02_17525 [Pyrinomonadaceae bacterium]|nr:hypothetical protein [Pyrinomonadaceae bacterium]
MAKKGKDLTGTACTVTSGPNKGKTGTYTTDEDGNLWCEGTWGGTQCATKCADAAVENVGQVFDYGSGGVKHEYDGLFSNEAGEVFHVQAVLDGKSRKPTRLAVARVLPTPLSFLQKSQSVVDRALGGAIEARLKKRK